MCGFCVLIGYIQINIHAEIYVLLLLNPVFEDFIDECMVWLAILDLLCVVWMSRMLSPKIYAI